MTKGIPVCLSTSATSRHKNYGSGYQAVFRLDDHMIGQALDHELCKCCKVLPEDRPVLESLIRSRLRADEHARNTGNHTARLMMRVPEHRLPLLIELSRNQLISRELAWKYARKTWLDLKEVYPYRQLWEEFFSLELGEQWRFMDESERGRLNALPDEFKIYRGYNRKHSRAGLSWTMSKKVATKYASQFGERKIAQGLIRKELVAGLICSRGEHEVVLSRESAVINLRAVNTVRYQQTINMIE
ncbi:MULTISPECIES: hypothetical protein [Shewanella]|uniref:hypothetical protein n=1 Tax=Shewanella TaxID=22 RepID=UPI001C595652|nr:hypothetical protein [Shewanella algae]HDS1207846.1 hypothetical protein [Shewanella algae]